jgi:hypothetical protein
VIFVDQADEDDVMLTAPLEAGDRAYLLKGILPSLRPLPDEDYMQGPAVILHTLAKYSYILYRREVYWCAEWDPGLIVVRFSSDNTLAWAALRSPIPNFGFRTPNAEDLRNYQQDAENHQYNLVFNAWDARHDEDWRRRLSFKRARARTENIHEAALTHVQTLGEQMEVRYSSRSRYDRWYKRCLRNLDKWTGEGIRVMP